MALVVALVHLARVALRRRRARTIHFHVGFGLRDKQQLARDIAAALRATPVR